MAARYMTSVLVVKDTAEAAAVQNIELKLIDVVVEVHDDDNDDNDDDYDYKK